MIIGILILLAVIILYYVYEPFIDIYSDINGTCIILWYKSINNKRNYIIIGDHF